MNARLVLLATLLFGCDTMHVGEPPPSADPTPAPEPEDPGDAPCETLSRTDCRHSVVCTLVTDASRPDRYICREAGGNCEVGLRQHVSDRDRCDDREGCVWQTGSCYCDCRGAGQTAVPDGPGVEDCDCECAGGPPPGCAPRGP